MYERHDLIDAFINAGEELDTNTTQITMALCKMDLVTIKLHSEMVDEKVQRGLF